MNPIIVPIIGDINENRALKIANIIMPTSVATIALPKVVVLGVIIFPANHVGIETIIHAIIKAIIKDNASIMPIIVISRIYVEK